MLLELSIYDVMTLQDACVAAQCRAEAGHTDHLMEAVCEKLKEVVHGGVTVKGSTTKEDLEDD